MTTAVWCDAVYMCLCASTADEYYGFWRVDDNWSYSSQFTHHKHFIFHVHFARRKETKHFLIYTLECSELLTLLCSHSHIHCRTISVCVNFSLYNYIYAAKRDILHGLQSFRWFYCKSWKLRIRIKWKSICHVIETNGSRHLHRKWWAESP